MLLVKRKQLKEYFFKSLISKWSSKKKTVTQDDFEDDEEFDDEDEIE